MFVESSYYFGHFGKHAGKLRFGAVHVAYADLWVVGHRILINCGRKQNVQRRYSNLIVCMFVPVIK